VLRIQVELWRRRDEATKEAVARFEPLKLRINIDVFYNSTRNLRMSDLQITPMGEGETVDEIRQNGSEKLLVREF
jgi:hypothetical protein